jgi:predicted ATPase
MEQRWSFGFLLKRHRLAAGLTLERLAERAALSARSISDLERGVSQRPRRETVDLLSGALGLSDADRAAFEEAARSASLAPLEQTASAEEPGRLPLHLTSFVGRANEVDLILRLLREEGVRLLTLTGPGGTGKSRLAVEVAEAIGGELQAGVRFVELAPVTSPDDVPLAIGRAFGVAGTNGAAVLASVAAQVGDRELLVVLDNFEHVLAAAPAVVELLRACPRLSVLVTSRSPLRLSGEQELPVPPLPVPARDTGSSGGKIGGYPSVQLFVDRAARVRPSFALTDDTAPTVAAICARLDGLPLALELAAARMKLLTPRSLLRRLDGVASGSALELLTRGARDVPPHQRTLRDTMLWSYNLLTADEQRLFRRLAIFAGGFTLEAGCQVSGVGADDGQAAGTRPLRGGTIGYADIPASETLDLIGSLLDKSLLYVDEGPDGEPRFMMLETVRELGLEQLRASGEFEGIAERHARYYLALVEAIGPLLFADAAKLRRAQPEYHNTHEALRWLFHHG